MYEKGKEGLIIQRIHHLSYMVEAVMKWECMAAKRTGSMVYIDDRNSRLHFEECTVHYAQIQKNAARHTVKATPKSLLRQRNGKLLNG